MSEDMPTKDAIFWNLLDYFKKPEQCILAAALGGLCNRLKCLISSMRLADKFSQAVVMYWPRDSYCNCKFSDLFENKIPNLNTRTYWRIMNRIHANKRYNLISTWRLLTLPGELPNDFAKVFPSKKGNDIDLEFERIPLSIRKDFLTYINGLIPKKHIRKEVEDFSKMFTDSTISVNVRSWPEDKDRARHLFRIENVYAVMDRSAGADFFVSCDCLQVLENIIDRYGKRVLYYPKRTYVNDRSSKKGMQHALIDLLLLSKNKVLKASALSTFSEMAWWFGGCQAAVEIIEKQSDLQDLFAKNLVRDTTLLIPEDILERGRAKK